MSDGDFDHEPVLGLPELLPEGERMLWQGSPQPIRLAIEALSLKWIAAYFGLIALWQAGSAYQDGDGWREITALVVWTMLLAAAALGTLAGFGWGIARSTIYTVTNRRLVIRHGLAVPMTVNIPFTSIASAGLRVNQDGSGDVMFTMVPGHRAHVLTLWPHARPWQYVKPQPMFRAVAKVDRVAKIVADALAEAALQPKTVVMANRGRRQQPVAPSAAPNGLAVPS